MSRPTRLIRRRLHCESLEERFLLAIEAFPAPHAAEPMGSLLYRSSVAGDFELAGEVDLYTVDLQSGQSVSITGESDATVRLSLFLTGPDAQLIVGDVADAVGQSVFLQSPTIAQTGTHVIAVSGVEAMGGAYSVQLVLNGVVEESAYGGAANNSPETSQELTSAFTGVGARAATRAAVVGSWPSEEQSLVAREDFESGSLGARWRTSSSTENGRIRVSNGFGPRAGFLALFMDTANPAIANLNEAIWTVDLPRDNQFMLEFSHSSREVVQPLPAEFAGSVAGDGVAVSGDGVQWHTIFTPPSEDFVWRDYQVDLTAAAETHNIELGSDFQIKFQQYGDGMLPAAGSGFDRLAITRDFTGYEDWYQFPLEDGQTTSLALAGRAAGAIKLDLFDAAGNHLGTGVPANNATQVINDYVDRTDNDRPDVYFVRARGWGGDYALAIMRDIGFEAEDNDGLLAAAQDISVSGVVTGAVDANRLIDEAITFAVIGDWGSHDLPSDYVADMVTDTVWDVDFIVTTGDNNYGQIDETVGDWEAIVGARYGDYILGRADKKYPLQTSTVQRFFPSVGNHDGTSSGFGQTGESGGIIPGYVDYFVTDPDGGPRLGPGNGYHGPDQSYYDVRWGPIHLFAVDSDHARLDHESLEEQQLWLETTARQSDALWKFAFFHHGPYSSSWHGSDPSLQWDFSAWGIDAVFSGHDHVYERIVGLDDGQLYFVSGLGGRSKYSLGDPIPGSQLAYNSDFGALRVTVDATNVEFEFLSVNDGAHGAHGGRLIDRHTIYKDTDPADFFRFEVNAGDQISVSALPGDVIGLENNLDVLLELYDPTSQLVAMDQDRGSLEHVASLDGTYSVRVAAEDGVGEYLLSVSGNTGQQRPFEVMTSIPAGGSSFNGAAGLQVKFNEQVLLSSVATGDLTFEGTAALSVEAVDGQTLRFGVPPELAEGLVNVTIEGGAILDLQGRSVAPFRADVTLDQTRPFVTGVVRNDGRDLPDRIESLAFQFSEDVSAGLAVTDVRIFDVSNRAEISTKGVRLDASTGRFDMTNLSLPAAEYHFELIAQQIHDRAGNVLDGNADDGDDNYRSTQSLVLTGDADLSGAVDALDFAIWYTHRFTGDNNSWQQADFNGDGVTDGADFNIWFANRFLEARSLSADGLGDKGHRRTIPRAPLRTLLIGAANVESDGQRLESQKGSPYWRYGVVRHDSGDKSLSKDCCGWSHDGDTRPTEGLLAPRETFGRDLRRGREPLAEREDGAAVIDLVLRDEFRWNGLFEWWANTSC